MTPTEFTRKIPTEELVEDIRSALELPWVAEIEVDLDEEAQTAGGIPVHVRQDIPLDDGYTAQVEDYYEVSDFEIEVYDWSGDTRTPTLRWRKRMLDRFGPDYATAYLLDGKRPEELK